MQGKIFLCDLDAFLKVVLLPKTVILFFYKNSNFHKLLNPEVATFSIKNYQIRQKIFSLILPEYILSVKLNVECKNTIKVVKDKQITALWKDCCSFVTVWNNGNYIVWNFKQSSRNVYECYFFLSKLFFSLLPFVFHCSILLHS